MDLSIETIRRFPSLAAALDKLPETPDDLTHWLIGQTAANDHHGLRIGSGRRYAARLLLHLGGQLPTFDLRTALGAWDAEHLAAAQAVVFTVPGERGDVPDSDSFAAGCLTVP